jgi:3-hydroxybutyryl-CoA dehydrogenase
MQYGESDALGGRRTRYEYFQCGDCGKEFAFDLESGEKTVANDLIENVTIVGAGFMGYQIGLQCALHGLTVTLTDRSQEVLDTARAKCAAELDRRIIPDYPAIMERLVFTTDLAEGVSRADLVFEAVPEDLKLKRQLFRELDRLCPWHTILASNSSSLWVNEFAEVRLHMVLNTHFYPMIWERPLVELGGSTVSEATMRKMIGFFKEIELIPLVVIRESTGFLFNRVWRAIKRECLAIIDEGVASFEDVDRAWMIGLNQKVGPFGIMDASGLDVVRDIELIYHRKSGDKRDMPPQFLEDMVAAGQVGVKARHGFYTYPNPDYRDPAWLKGEKEDPNLCLPNSR